MIASQAEIDGSGNRGHIVNAISGSIIGTNHLATLLRGVIFFREPPLGSRFDLKRMGLRAEHNDNQIVMGGFGALRPGGSPEVLEAIVLERRAIAIRVIDLVRAAARPWVEQVKQCSVERNMVIVAIP